MWVRKTPDEIKEEKRTKKRNFVKPAIIGGIVCILVVTFVEGWNDNISPLITLSNYELSIAPIDAWILRIPIAFLAGCFLVSVFNISHPTFSNTYVCMKCGSIKKIKPSSCYVCGGTCEQMSKIKWVDDENGYI